MCSFHAARTVTHLEKLNHGVNTECRRHTVCSKSLIKLDERRGRGHEPKSCLLTRIMCCTVKVNQTPNTPGKSSLIAADLFITSATFTLIYCFCQIILPKANWSEAKYNVRIQKSVRNLAQRSNSGSVTVLRLECTGTIAQKWVNALVYLQIQMMETAIISSILQISQKSNSFHLNLMNKLFVNKWNLAINHE